MKPQSTYFLFQATIKIPFPFDNYVEEICFRNIFFALNPDGEQFYDN